MSVCHPRRLITSNETPVVPGFANVVKGCLIVRMIFETLTAEYINTSLTCDIGYGLINNIQFTQIKLRNNIVRIM